MNAEFDNNSSLLERHSAVNICYPVISAFVTPVLPNPALKQILQYK